MQLSQSLSTGHFKHCKSYRRRREGRSQPDKDDPCLVGVIVSLSGEVLAVNEPASSVYDVEPGDTLDALAMCSDSVAQLYALLNNTIDLEQPVFLRLSRAMSGSPIIARVSRTALCVQIDTTDVSWSRELSDDLQSQYDLSVAEVSILEMFIEGFALEDIASARNSSMATVRTQQRALFEKLDVCSMSDLIRFSIGVVAKLSRVPALGEDRAGLTSSDVEQKIAGLFMTAFNYSQAETDIALMLARGYSPTAIAVKREASIRTVRTQIHHALKKIGARNVPELVRLTCALAIMHAHVGTELVQ